jgi:hypothetical protein
MTDVTVFVFTDLYNSYHVQKQPCESYIQRQDCSGYVMNRNVVETTGVGFYIFLSLRMARVVVAMVAFEGHSELLKQVESLYQLLLSSVPLTLGVAIFRDTGEG